MILMGGVLVAIAVAFNTLTGGIFLSPLILFMGWADTRIISGVAAVFVLCNSTAGLFGNLASVGSLPAQLPYYAAAVIAGALLGSSLGVSRLPKDMILKALGLVLVVAGLKLVFFS